MISKDIDTNRRWWNGKKVITISNNFEVEPENESLNVGIVADVVGVSQANNPVPLVIFEGDTEPKMTFATVLEYSDELLENLKRHTAEERWLIIQSFAQRF